MTTIQARITPQLLKWARKRMSLSHDMLAYKIGVKAEQVVGWEEGAMRPTFKQAQELARHLRVPFGYLYLSSPPKETVPLPDTRTIGGRKLRRPSPDFIDVLNDMTLKQEWYKEYLQDERQQPLTFIGKFKLGDDVKAVSRDITTTLEIDDTLRRESTDWEEFLTKLVRRCESLGVLIVRNSVVGNNNLRTLSVNEFRGFAICDELAPLIFINSQDSKTAQIFTLVHELVHLWIGESAISNPDLKKRTSQQTNVSERFCNQVAAEILIPEAAFVQSWNGDESIEDNLRTLSKEFRVSTAVVLRRAYELEALRYDEYIRYLKREEGKWKRRRGIKKETGDFYILLSSRNSSTLTRLLVEGVMGGKFLHRDAARLLGVNVGTLQKISERLMGAA